MVYILHNVPVYKFHGSENWLLALWIVTSDALVMYMYTEIESIKAAILTNNLMV